MIWLFLEKKSVKILCTFICSIYNMSKKSYLIWLYSLVQTSINNNDDYLLNNKKNELDIIMLVILN